MHARTVPTILAGLTSATAVIMVTGTTPATAATATATATFRPNSGNYETTLGRGTDGLRQVAGGVTFSQSGTGMISAQGQVSGLAPNTLYVTVPCVDPYCTPVPGVTAFPSGAWQTDGTGAASFSVSVNPQAINPVGQFSVAQSKSVSIRQVIVSGVQLPGVPIGTPTLPNAAAVEACDEHPGLAAGN